MKQKPEMYIQNYICISTKGCSNLNLGETYSGFDSTMSDALCIYPHGIGSGWVYIGTKSFAKEPEDIKK